jgi:hypothetical protein
MASAGCIHLWRTTIRETTLPQRCGARRLSCRDDTVFADLDAGEAVLGDGPLALASDNERVQ